MDRSLVQWLFCGWMLLNMAVGPFVRAESPPYLLLRAPESSQHPHATGGRYSGTGLGVSTQSYSYGWFGAPPRKHWSRHFGFYRNYTQWSAK